jgi:hexosaminidase
MVFRLVFRLLRSFSTITVLLCAIALLPEAVHALWPQPRNLQAGSGALRLDPSFAIHVAVPNAPQDLLDAAERTRSLLLSDQLGRLVVGRGADDLQTGSFASVLSSLTLTLFNSTSGAPQPIMTEATLPLGSRDEAYSLVVPADGSGAVLSANSTLGLFRGLTTFGQLWYTASGTVYILGVPVAIQDSPAYVCLSASGCLFLSLSARLLIFSGVHSRIAGSCLIRPGTSM